MRTWSGRWALGACSGWRKRGAQGRIGQSHVHSCLPDGLVCRVLGLTQCLRILSSLSAPTLQYHDPLIGPLSLLTVEALELIPCLP